MKIQQEAETKRDSEDNWESQMYTNNCANTTLLDDSWFTIEKSQWSIDIVGFAKDLQKDNLPIVNVVTKTTLPNN